MDRYDISPEQIEQAKLLSQGTDIKYYVSASEDLSFPDNSFDVITACQCFWYFDHENLFLSSDVCLKAAEALLSLYGVATV
ncbi:MAG: class I SAM-dependent methyltransferase [[Eubacterium] siraeum]